MLSMLKNKPLLTIITVVLNDIKNIEQTLLSVIADKNSLIEYIVIDGGSKDGTVEIIKNYSNSIDYWVSENDSGVYDAMNKGIKASNGQVIGLLNSGDYYNPGALNIVIKKIKDIKHTKFIIAGGISLINSKNQSIKTYHFKLKRLSKKFINMPFFHPSTFISSAAYSFCGLYNKNYKISADYDLSLCLLANNIEVLENPFIFTSMRIGGLSDSSANFLIMQRESYQIRRKYKGLIFCTYVVVRETLSFFFRSAKKIFSITRN
jgi:glycosyltransferase involved in cell wall biosynthesis